MSNRSVRRRRALCATGAFAILAGAPLVWSGHATAAGTFDATAAAYGFDYLMENASIAAGVSPQFAGPVAQAALTSLPSGTSFASLPYPGEVAAGVPGLIPSIVQGLPQTPAYPFMVTSGLGQGKQEINQPGISMRAQTEETDASSHAVFGTEGSGSVSDAVVRVSGERVSADAVARHAALSIGDQGEIGQVISKASVLRGYDGKVTKTSSLSISGIRFPGLEFTVPANSPAPAPVPNTPPFPQIPLPFAGMTFHAPTFGFYDGQFTVQLPGAGPQQYAVDNAAVEKAFEAQGMRISYIKAVETPTGITGATFTLHWKAPAPPDNPLYTGPTDFTLVFGRANASISSEGSTAFSPVPGSTDGALGGSAAPGVDGAGTGGVLPGAVDGAGLLPGGLDGAGALAGTDAMSGGVPTANLVPAADRVQAATTTLSIDALSNLYWVLVAAGVIATFSIPTLRLLGARSR
ncbi:hypothetical protein GCM10009547_06950 [Sporichthya brevicatena]|uniref:Uncharacterized protein n=1 Tax=Sporichthya brevicatena TaxID=171442 RepID=A0ABN1GAS2_9ACTN